MLQACYNMLGAVTETIHGIHVNVELVKPVTHYGYLVAAAVWLGFYECVCDKNLST